MRFALLAEGPADAPLVEVMVRLCRSLGASEVDGENGNDILKSIDVGRKVDAKARALLELDPDFDILFIHVDADNEGLENRRGQIDEAMTRCGATVCYARVVPVRMTESWLLADEQRIRDVVGYPGGRAPLDLPKRSKVEDVGNVKERLRAALSKAKRPTKHAKGELPLIDNLEFGSYRAELLETLDIHGPVTDLPSWRAVVQDTEARLAELESNSH